MRYQLQANSYRYKSVAEIVEEVFVAHDKAANREQSRLLVLYLAKILAEQERSAIARCH